MLAWFVATLGHTLVLGTLPAALLQFTPLLDGFEPMPGALVLFSAGVLVLGFAAYVLAALGYQISRLRSA